MPSLARPWIAHLYNSDWSFRAMLGPLAAARDTKSGIPGVRQVLNSGFQPATLELPTLNATVQPGNLIVVTEQAGQGTGSAPDGVPVFGGLVEDTPDAIQSNGQWRHQISVIPFVAELGDAYLNNNYSTPTDVAQMVRDAVAQTNHCRVTPYSCPNTGVLAIYNFSYAQCLEVLDHARLIAGGQWCWFVDAIGVVWFQPINTNGAALFTAKQAVDYNEKQYSASISALKNFVLCVGDIPKGSTTPATATYNNPSSQSQYGLRMLNPPVAVPGITDTGTLQDIANTIGAVYDRVIHRVTLNLPTFGKRILLGQPGGPTMRYWEPAKTSLPESETGSGQYSATYSVLEVQNDGIEQQVVIGETPPSAVSDVQYMVERLTSRVGLSKLIVPPLQGSTKLVTPSGPGGSGITYDGSIPEITANDPSGFARAQIGNLPNYTDPNGLNSPAQWGFRALDPNGNNIFDSLGLMAVMKSLGLSAVFVNTGGLTSTAWVAMPGSVTFGFTITRQVNVVFLFLASCYITAGAGQIRARCNLVGQSQSGALKFAGTGTAAIGNGFGHLYVASLPAGTYAVQNEYQVDSGVTGFIDQSYVQGFQLGA